MLYQKQSKTGDPEHVKGVKSRALNQKQPVTAVPAVVAGAWQMWCLQSQTFHSGPLLCQKLPKNWFFKYQ